MAVTGAGVFPGGGPGANPQRFQAMQQLKTDLQAAGIDMKAIRQQVATSAGGTPGVGRGGFNPQAMDAALQASIAQVSDPNLQAKLQSDLQTMQSFRPSPEQIAARQQHRAQVDSAFQQVGLERRTVMDQVRASFNGQRPTDPGQFQNALSQVLQADGLNPEQIASLEAVMKPQRA